MSEALDRASCISHRQCVHFFVMYDDFLDIAKSSEHQHKLAAFWRVLETKTNEKMIHNEGLIKNAKDNGLPIPKTDLWIEITYTELSQRTLGVYKSSSFKIASVESDRLGFTKSRVKKRPVNPLDPDSKLVDCKEYLLLTGTMQSVLNGGDMPTPVEFDSPLLNGYEERGKKRKEKQKMRITPVEFDSTPVKNDRDGVKNDSTPVEFDQSNNILIESSSIKENKEERNVTDTAHADVSTPHEPLSEKKAVEETKVPETESQVEVDTNPPVKETVRKRKTGKSAQSKKNEIQALLAMSEIAAPKKPDLSSPYTVDLLMRLADYYRGSELTVSTDTHSRYQKALKAAMSYIQRRIPVDHVDKLFCFMLGRGEELGFPDLKDTKWIDGGYNTDLWTIEPNHASKWLECQKIEQQLRLKSGSGPAPDTNTTQMTHDEAVKLASDTVAQAKAQGYEVQAQVASQDNYWLVYITWITGKQSKITITSRKQWDSEFVRLVDIAQLMMNRQGAK